MTALWTANEAVTATGGNTQGAWQAHGVSIDTRTLEKGDLFVALKDVRDGHDFVAQALKNGAAAALVDHIPDGVSADAPLLIVDDVLSALEALGRFARARISGKVIGVTGSVGKTGTKEMLRSALAGQGAVHAAEKSYNNHWGVPLTLARMPRDTDFAVIEIGMNHPGEITPLAQMADLDVAVVTIVAPVHLAAFSGVDEIAHAKAEIFQGLRANGHAVINADIDTFSILKSAANNVTKNIWTFGCHDDADFKLIAAHVDDHETRVIFGLQGQKIEYTLSSPGVHLAMNSLAVIAVCEALDVVLTGCIAGLKNWQTPQGRGSRETLRLGPDHTVNLINESYNANPTSMASALQVLAQSQNDGRKVAILGDMLELGPAENQLHADLAKLTSIKSIDKFLLVGPLMQAFHTNLPSEKQDTWVQNITELESMLIDLLQDGDTVMIKGSLGSKVSKLVDFLREKSE